MAEPMFIGELIAKIMDGNIRIPSFQRGFVWDADRVAYLMDSIYKGFPFGTLLFWSRDNRGQTTLFLATQGECQNGHQSWSVPYCHLLLSPARLGL